MAKRKKHEEEEVEDFEFPEFDRRDYMKGEINKGKSVIATMAVAPLFSYISMIIFDLTMEWTLGFVMFIPGLFLLGPVHNFFGVDVTKFDKKEYFMNGAMFFFTWLTIWVILMNPPFNDFTDPTVEHFSVEVMIEDEWIPLSEADLENGVSYRVNLTAKITDNVAVREESIRIQIQDDIYPMEQVEEHHYSILHDFTARTNPYTFIISMEDVNGNRNEVEISRLIGS